MKIFLLYVFLYISTVSVKAQFLPRSSTRIFGSVNNQVRFMNSRFTPSATL
eukprot:Pgem_evm1s7514